MNKDESNQFLDASTHLYKRLCPSVYWPVGPAIRPWVRHAFLKYHGNGALMTRKHQGTLIISFIYSFIHSFFCSFTQSFIQSFTHLYKRLCPSVRWSIMRYSNIIESHSFIYSFSHSFGRIVVWTELVFAIIILETFLESASFERVGFCIFRSW